MQSAFSDRAPEKRASAVFTAAIHIFLLALLLNFRPAFDKPMDTGRPLAVDFLPAPPPESPLFEPKVIEEEPARTSSTLSLQRPGGSEAGSPAPREEREDMDRTISPLAVAAFPSGPAPATGIAPAGTAGMGRAVDGAGTGTGGRGTGTGTGTGSGSGTGSRPASGARATPKDLQAPRWISKPTFSEMELHNPRRAVVQRVSGTAVLACRVDSRQRARRCRILSESPRGYGFGAAALETVRLGRIGPAMRGAIPDYKAWVRIPITFHNCKKDEPACIDSLD
ncbi:MAG TPA: TonB family protein [Allosphingosinicella sp.]|jgi:protein TonB